VSSQIAAYVPPADARQALFGLVADLTWARRSGAPPASLERIRNQALTLLVRVDRGDRDAARAAMRLARSAKNRAA
jgi:RNase P/RNase MRP subunit POP5